MSYTDAWQAEADWIDSTDADYLQHEGIKDGSIWDCPQCEMATFIWEEPIQDSDKIRRGCDRCDHQIICDDGDETGIR